MRVTGRTVSWSVVIGRSKVTLPSHFGKRSFFVRFAREASLRAGLRQSRIDLDYFCIAGSRPAAQTNAALRARRGLSGRRLLVNPPFSQKKEKDGAPTLLQLWKIRGIPRFL